MRIIEVNRAELAWSLNAVLPHVAQDITAFVGFAAGCLFATDGYTVGVASLDLDLREQEFGLTKKEAQDLLRFVRPTLKRHDQETVELLVAERVWNDPPPPERADEPSVIDLHVGMPSSGDSPDGRSEVFEVMVPGVSFQAVYGLVQKVREAKPEDLALHPDLPFKRDFSARFAKAARSDDERLWYSPRTGNKYGACYVRVGDHFEGAIAGMTYEENCSTA